MTEDMLNGPREASAVAGRRGRAHTRTDIAPTRRLARAERRTRSHGSAAVYAFVAGAAYSVPIRHLDAIVARSIGGAALRRVSVERGAVLSAQARRVLADVVLPSHRASTSRTLVRALAGEIVARVRGLSATAVVWRAFAAVSLFDTYLGQRTDAAPIELEEALRIRAAMELALSEAFDLGLTSMPREIGEAMSSVIEALTTEDREGRPRTQAAIDAILDALADVPGELVGACHERFEAVLGVLGREGAPAHASPAPRARG